MKTEQKNILIDALGCWYEDGSKKLDNHLMISNAAKQGYLLDVKICNNTLKDYIESKETNHNSTFYKTWEDVVSKDRLDLFIDQILHYMSTYGTDYGGEAYVPNNEPVKIDYSTYKVISCVTMDEMVKKVFVLLNGIALNELLSEAIAELLIELSDKGIKFNIDDIKNKETLTIIVCSLIEKGCTIHKLKTDIIRRCINYMLTGNSMIVQSKRILQTIRTSHKHQNDIWLLLSNLDNETNTKLASEFLRYRKWWCAVKHSCVDGLYGSNDIPEIGTYINRLRTVAKRVHKPFFGGFWENITKMPVDTIKAEFHDHIKELIDNPYKIIKLLEMIRLHKIQSKTGTKRLFKIRTGSIYKKSEPTKYDPVLDDVSKELLKVLVNIIACNREEKYGAGVHPTIEFSKYIKYMLPSSGKSFVGNIPFGSYYKMHNDMFLGIYWRNEWGTRDFDLSLVNDKFEKIGWDAGFKNEDIIFSGDMTDANPEATELLYIKKDCPECIIFVNRFNGNEGSKYRLFVGQEKIKDLHKSYMVDPNNINIQTDIISKTKEQILGYINDNKCYVMQLGTGNSQISSCDSADFDTWRDICEAHIPMKEILLLAGYREYMEKFDPKTGERILPDIDLASNNASADTIIGLI